jgi:HAD superfamily hydrolase (TIGR01459 family)
MRPWARHGWPGAALAMMRRISGLRDIAREFDAMLIDQFGVIHDGQRLYPGAAEVLAELHELNIPVIVMTNSGKRAAPNTARVVKMGIAREHFVDCVSSGEVAFRSLDVKRALLIGKDGEDYGFEPMQFVARPDEAEVMLILGSNAPKTSLDDYRKLFAGLTLPAVCCNPDKLMITTQGLQPAPGAIASVYEEMGGKVTWIGKPHASIYEFALERLGNPRRVLCIGDSAEHDVAGGRGAGLATLLVHQGVSADVAEAHLHPAPDMLIKDFVW